jgi:hypothetical protein
MKGSVSPAVIVVIIVIAAVALGLAGWKYLGPSGAPPSEDLKGMKFDLNNVKPGELDQVKKDLEAAGASRAGTAGGGGK